MNLKHLLSVLALLLLAACSPKSTPPSAAATSIVDFRRMPAA